MKQRNIFIFTSLFVCSFACGMGKGCMSLQKLLKPVEEKILKPLRKKVIKPLWKTFAESVKEQWKEAKEFADSDYQPTVRSLERAMMNCGHPVAIQYLSKLRTEALEREAKKKRK